MARCGRIHTRFSSFDLVLWHRFQQRNLISTKTEKQKNNTIKTHHITKKHSIWRFTREKHKKGKINQSKPGVCAVLFILWFVFGVLVLFLVFLFVFWVSSFLFFCLQCLHFSWFNYFSKMLLGFKPFFITKSIKTNSW